MSLTLTALKFMIGLTVLQCILVAFVNSDIPGLGMEFLLSLLNLAMLIIFFQALRKPVVWMAYLFFGICILSFIGGIGGGLRLENLFGLIDAVLSFVAAAGIFHWRRDRQQAIAE